MVFESFFGGAFFSGGFFAPGTDSGGGTSRLLRRGRLPKKYSDIDLQEVYRRHRGEDHPALIEAAQVVAEGIASPDIPEVLRDELVTTLIPFVMDAEFFERAADVRRAVDWAAMVQDQTAMQKLIELKSSVDEDDDYLLLTVH